MMYQGGDEEDELGLGELGELSAGEEGEEENKEQE